MLCLAERGPYITFLRTHQLAYRALLAALPSEDWVSATLRNVVRALNQDLQVMDAPALDRPMIGLCDPLHPLGVAYVVCGSHFGKRVLRRRWRVTADPQVLAAGAYLANDDLQTGWARFLDAIDDLLDPATNLLVLAADADRTFAVFYDSLIAVKNWEHADAAA